LAQEVGELIFEGISKTKESSLFRIIDCKVGVEIDSVMLQNDVDILSRLPGIAAAHYSIESISSSKIKVIFLLEENFTLIPSVNLWNADSILAFQVGLYDVNFLGRNVTLGGYYQFNGLHTYGINFMAPYLIKGKVGVELNVQRWSSYEPLYFGQYRVDYQFHFNANEALLLYKINARNSLKAGVSLFREMYVRQEQMSSDNFNIFPDNVNLKKRLFKFEYEYNNVNYLYYRLKGVKNLFNFQAVKTGGGLEKYLKPFLIAWNDLIWYKRNAFEGNLAVRLRVGLASNSNSPFAPFALDNQKNIRGVGNIVSRGTGTFILNVEYRNTLLMKKWFRLQGNIFVDSGAFRAPGKSFKNFFKNENIDLHTGFGLRFIHSSVYNAVFRIDYGIGLTKENTNGFVIGIGQYF